MKNRPVSLFRLAALLGAAAALFAASSAQAALPLGQLTNLSARAKLAAGQTLTTGFVITGQAPMRVLVRGIGPSLTPFGVTDAMPATKIVLAAITPAGPVKIENDHWYNPFGPRVQTERMKQLFLDDGECGFALDHLSRDAAILAELSPGSYTLTVSGVSATDAGTVLAEIYDTRPIISAQAGRLTNLSVLHNSTPAAPVLVGFTISNASYLLFRAVGPGLAPFGVAGALADPQLELFDSFGTRVISNDNWDAPPSDPTITRQTTQQAGAFPLTAGSKDAVFITPGQGRRPEGFTLRGSGVNGTSGMVLMEIYEVPVP